MTVLVKVASVGLSSYVFLTSLVGSLLNEREAKRSADADLPAPTEHVDEHVADGHEA